jgi:hypothetical protein
MILLIYRSGLLIPDYVKEQGAYRFERGAYTIVCEHFESVYNTAIGH